MRRPEGEGKVTIKKSTDPGLSNAERKELRGQRSKEKDLVWFCAQR
jgi:hypothetical protein